MTKRETDAGVPDIENLLAISILFRVSLDELRGNTIAFPSKQDFLFDSVTEYDIDCKKSFDITLTRAKQLALAGYECEKARAVLPFTPAEFYAAEAFSSPRCGFW